jgi:hypothetical protein
LKEEMIGKRKESLIISNDGVRELIFLVSKTNFLVREIEIHTRKMILETREMTSGTREFKVQY